MEIQVAGDGTGHPGFSDCLLSTPAPCHVSFTREGSLLFQLHFPHLTIFSFLRKERILESIIFISLENISPVIYAALVPYCLHIAISLWL